MIGISTELRSDRLQLVLDAIDGESDEYSGAHLLIYSGDRVGTGEEIDEYENELLIDFELSYPSGTITDGVLTFAEISDVNSLEYGTASWARIVDAVDAFVIDLSVTSTLGNGDVKIDNLEVFAGVLVQCSLASITEGNA